MWLGWGWVYWRYISCGWDGDGSIGGTSCGWGGDGSIGATSHVVGVGMGLLEVHLMWLGWGFVCQEYVHLM